MFNRKREVSEHRELYSDGYDEDFYGDDDDVKAYNPFVKS